MVLNNSELTSRIYDLKDERHLSVIPTPTRDKFTKSSGASVDLKLGRWFRTMKQSNVPSLKLNGSGRDTKFSKQHYVAFGKPFILHPGKFVLGITLEWIALPLDLTGMVSGKSSLGRRGLIIETAAGIHPAFCGCITLELANVGEIPIELMPGMDICQVFFHYTNPSGDGAQSQFKGARKPGLGKLS
jgi:dCTP deaminase